MSRKPKHPPIPCQFFIWLLFLRNDVYYADGRRGQHGFGKYSLNTRDYKEALIRLTQLDLQKAIEVGLANPQQVLDTGTISIPDGWKRYIDFSGRSGVLGGVSAATLKRYSSVRDKHIEFCARHGIANWSDFGKQQIEKYGNWLGKDYADRTAYYELTLLKSVNGWLIANKHLPAASRLVYPLRKPLGTDTYSYSKAEVSTVVTYCFGQTKLIWLGRVIMALALTGLRIAELAGLRWTDIDLNQNTIRVADERSSRRKQIAGTARTTKGRRSRVLPIHPALKNVLLTIEHRADGYVFHGAKGGKLNPRGVLKMYIEKVIDVLKAQLPTPAGEIGFEHGRLHSFRHYFCSQAFLGGASEGEIREWLGHASSKMVEHYRHLRNDDAQRKMSQIDFLDSQDDRPGEVA